MVASAVRSRSPADADLSLISARWISFQPLEHSTSIDRFWPMCMKYDEYSLAWKASIRGKQRIRDLFAAFGGTAGTEVKVPNGVVPSALVKGSYENTIRLA